VHAVVAGAFGYSGQKCSACSRAIVLEGVYDQFLNRLIEATRSLRIGPAEDAGAFVGPVIDADARNRIMRMIDVGKREARLAYAGELSAAGALTGGTVTPKNSAGEGTGGTNPPQNSARKSGTKYALTGGLHSRSPANIERVRREFRVGNLYINRKITGALVDRQPFGGFKLSGTGPKAGGPDYLPQFLHARAITENTLRHGFAPDNDPASEAAGVGE
jgi:RHH-type proline utilization regulon transcriptional repressor/proline dehydrogenase/delta 1-pyrroline-5-carboxylate dehydrogenase